MSELRNLALKRIAELIGEATEGYRQISNLESQTKQPELGLNYETESAGYRRIYEPLHEAKEWLEAISPKG